MLEALREGASTKTLSAHIHKALPGKTGPVDHPPRRQVSRPEGCVTWCLTKSLKAVGTNPRGYYVNVHTRRYLNGADQGTAPRQLTELRRARRTRRSLTRRAG